MNILVTYDVNTQDKAGRRRLRRVAKACEGCGQRVQLSVFECRVDSTQLQRLVHRLTDEIDDESDSLRIYRLADPRANAIIAAGRDPYYDPDGPLVL
ncbi:MAG: CRISPR-associated endonuclease Cas2 [Actinomycetota bacterium]|nr:CRISPR-associated endonuclease Cas2 [Actinomycetota bacterium]